MNEGHLGKFSFGGERAATDNHPAVIQYLPLDESVQSALAVGTLLKARDKEENDVVYEPFLSSDAEVTPVAVVDLPCDPTGEKGEKSAACVVHGTVRASLLKTGDDQVPTGKQLAALAASGIYAL